MLAEHIQPVYTKCVILYYFIDVTFINGRRLMLHISNVAFIAYSRPQMYVIQLGHGSSGYKKEN